MEREPLNSDYCCITQHSVTLLRAFIWPIGLIICNARDTLIGMACWHCSCIAGVMLAQ